MLLDFVEALFYLPLTYKAMPTPALMISKASEHDLGITKEMLDDAANIRVFDDMAFIDKA